MMSSKPLHVNLTHDASRPSPVGARQVWDSGRLVLNARCAFCASEEFREVSTRSDGLKIKECLECGLAYVDPRPSSSQLLEYYDAGYFSGEKDFFEGRDYCRERDAALATGDVTGFREVASNFECGGKTILDIGCATGSLLCLLKSLGPKELIGIDVAEYPISYGVERYGLDLRRATLESAGFPDEYFDLIIMTDVIEHVEELPRFMPELRRVLRPGGSVYLITPNYSAYRHAGERWSCLHKDFEHLHYFSPESLRLIAARSNFRLAKWWTDGVPFELASYSKFYPMGLHRFLDPRVAAKNALWKLRYKLSRSGRRDLGHNLHAILTA